MKTSAKLISVMVLGVCLGVIAVELLHGSTVVIDRKTDGFCTTSASVAGGGRRIGIGMDNRWLVWISCASEP